MNKERRKEIKRIITGLESLKESINTVLDEEQESFDNLPEGLQYSQRGENMEEAISSMEEAIDSLDSVIESLEEVT